MAWPAINIRTAIVELLKGTIGTTRTVIVAQADDGTFTGDPGHRAKVLNQTSVVHRFEVLFGAQVDHPDNYVGQVGNQRLMLVDLTVNIWRNLKSTPQKSLNDSAIADMASDVNDFVQALSYPGNLTQTAAAGATNLVDGCLFGPGGTGQPSVGPIVPNYEEVEVSTSLACTGIVEVIQIVS